MTAAIISFVAAAVANISVLLLVVYRMFTVIAW